MYTKYNYKHHTSTYNKYNYIYMSTIFICLLDYI